MSMPKFPDDTGKLTRESAINQILSSIAMEELGLSHIINAEGEKMQYVLGALEGSVPPQPATVDQVLQVNESIRKMLETTAQQQMLLKGKMSAALDAAVKIPPMPEITIGENGNWFVNGEDTGVEATGPQGEAGPQGPVGLTGPQGPIGLTGPIGPQGSEGPEGPQGVQGPQGSQGPAGSTGPQGPIGLTGPQGPVGLTGPQGPIGLTGPVGPQGPQGTLASAYGLVTSPWWATATVPAGSDVPFSVAGDKLTFLNVSLAENGLQVTNAGVYFIHYGVNVDGGQTGALNIKINGTGVPSAFTTFSTMGGTMRVCGSLIQLLPAFAVITVTNTTYGPVKIGGGAAGASQTWTFGDLSVFRLA